MEANLLLEQFSRYKRIELEKSPFHFLLDANIELNPHQINAFCAAIQALKTGGIVLADEVGLGKTIEAGLVLKYVLKSGGKRILIALPASLRKQWELELDDKFNLQAAILDRLTVEKDIIILEKNAGGIQGSHNHPYLIRLFIQADEALPARKMGLYHN
jgi:SNF2 family DNA or RNA helicase